MLLAHCCAQVVFTDLTLFVLTVELAKCTVTCIWCATLKYPFTCCAHSFSPPCGMCFYVTALGFSMMATVMTVNPLGNDLSSCLHSSCTAPPCPGGHAAVDSISPASSSECSPVMPDWMCVEAKGSFCLSDASVALLCATAAVDIRAGASAEPAAQKILLRIWGGPAASWSGQQTVSVVCGCRMFGPVRGDSLPTPLNSAV